MDHRGTFISPVKIPINNITLEGDLSVPEKPAGIIIFAHGSGSSHLSPRNQFVAKYLQEHSLATLLFDLLTKEEDMIEYRFDINLLSVRLARVTEWAIKQPELKNLPIGYFGASTGSAAALKASTQTKNQIKAIVSRGGRPDLAIHDLDKVNAPVLLIVGGKDNAVIALNQEAMTHIQSEQKLEIIPGATHLFEESGTLEQVAELAKDWFLNHFNK